MSPLPVASLAPPTAPGGSETHAVQRAFGMRGGGVTGALASAAAATVSQSLERFRPRSSSRQAPPAVPPPASGESAAQDPPPPSFAEATASTAGEPLPGYTPVPPGGFDPDKLSDLQLDALVHRIIGRITRHVRTELRMDRERVGRLRDPRR
ncbi:hypothetical protein ACIO3O_14620 [Streptomyces sp. NPDC087440]|uniref:hypothetical protein n=1 Tax=Streptomyces sp. NPDC087440 TaxID=3365790 RepID=UPI0037F6BC26